MRLWSLHPKYLDSKGLVALWREALLAKHVLEGRTKGYKNHPQLNRFKKAAFPIDMINQYLSEVYLEALKRDFNFDKQKVDWKFRESISPVTNGQLKYEVDHLLRKLEKRDPDKHKELKSISKFITHPIFKLVKGEIEEWEILALPSKISVV
jgi:hypothetical protein